MDDEKLMRLTTAIRNDSFVERELVIARFITLHCYMRNKGANALFIRSQKRQFVNNSKEISRRG